MGNFKNRLTRTQTISRLAHAAAGWCGHCEGLAGLLPTREMTYPGGDLPGRRPTREKTYPGEDPDFHQVKSDLPGR
jgi:hypothetical protein